MIFKLIFFAYFLTILTEHETNALDFDLAGVLELGVQLVLLNLKRIGTVSLIDDATFVIPDSLKEICIGSIKLDNTYIYGFDTLNIGSISASALDDSDTDINMCINIGIDRIGIATKYDADIGIIDEIPIYGDGELNLAVSPEIDLCLNIYIDGNFSQVYVEDLSLLLALHDSPSSISRFWKNEDVSEILTAVINILEDVACMWLSYEKECISCLISPVIQYVVNDILPNDTENDLVIDCPCLEEILGSKYDIGGNLKQLVYSYYEGNTTSYILSKSPKDIQKYFKIIGNHILDILSTQGISIDV